MRIPIILILFLVCFVRYYAIKEKIYFFILNVRSFFKLQVMKINFFFMKKFSDYPLFRVFFENCMNNPPFIFNTVEEAIDYFNKREFFIFRFFFALVFSFFYFEVIFSLIKCC